MPRNEPQRRRIDREAVRQSALPTGKTTTLILPDNVELFFPDKEDEFFLRIMPYEVTVPNHPDNQPVGNLYYRRPYFFHPNLGGSGRHPVCPRSTWGKRCAPCEQADILKQDWDHNKPAIKALKPKHMVLYACFDPRNPDVILVFDWASSKFSETLEKEINKGGTKYLDFAQPDCGMVIKFRVSKDTFVTDRGATKDFLTTDKLDFLDGKNFANLSDEILARVPHLDEIIKETSYEDMVALMNGGESDTAPADAGSDHERPKAPAEEEQHPEEERPAGAVTCKACGGKQVTSKGTPCVPCGGKGWALPPAPSRAPAPPTSEWDGSPVAPPTAPAPTQPAKPPARRRADTPPVNAAPTAPAAGGADEGWPKDW